jgi:hypothetical protein
MKGKAGDAVDWRSLACALGDVVVRSSDGAEAWLAGAVVLREDAIAAALFVAPDRGGDRAIWASARDRDRLGWLTPVDALAYAGTREPPSVIELAGARFDRARRLPLRAERAGEGAPDVGDVVVVGEYTRVGEMAIVMISPHGAWAWRGARLERGDYDVWKSGQRGR